MCCAQSTAKGPYEVEIKYIHDSGNNVGFLLNTHFTVEEWNNLGKMQRNEPGRPKLGRYRNPVSKHSMQSYVLIYCRLRKREPLTALGSHRRGTLISASAVPHGGDGAMHASM